MAESNPGPSDSDNFPSVENQLTDFRALCAQMLAAWERGDDIVGAMNRARAALAEPSWQPIHAAPRNGTPILGLAGTDQAVVVWEVDAYCPDGGYWSLTQAGSYAESSEWWPTHWQALPEVPAHALPLPQENTP